MAKQLTVTKPAQSLLLLGPDFIVRASEPARIARVSKRAPLTAEESEAYSGSGGEAQFYASNEQFQEIINIEMPGYFGPYTG